MKNSNKGLNHDEPILFEIGGMDKSGVDLNEPTFKENFIGECFDCLLYTSPSPRD